MMNDITKGFIFDLDGTTYIGNQAIDGSAETIALLRNKDYPVIFLSNNAISSRKSYVDKLKGMGIFITMDEIINSSYITAKYLRETLAPNESVLVIGEKPLFDELEFQEIEITDDPQKAKYVLLSWDRQFTYEKLNKAFQAWHNGATVLATNADRTCPTENGQIPDCGAIIGAVEGATGQPVVHIMGKPSHYMAEAAVNALKLDYRQCYMVGDRLETDIKMANDTGMNSVLVLTGCTSIQDLNHSQYKPKYILHSIKDLMDLELESENINKEK